MISKVHNSTSLFEWSEIIRHPDMIALNAALWMDINEYQAILRVAIWLTLLHFVLL